MKTCPRCGGIGKVRTPQEQIALGRRLRSKREQVGLSRQQLARSLRVSRQYLADVELGRRTARRRIVEGYQALRSDR